MIKSYMAVIIPVFAGSCAILSSGCAPLAVMGGTAAVATTAAEERGIKGAIGDTELEWRVSSRIKEINPELAHKINVVAREGRILLSGMVETPKMQIDAVRAAWEVPGVAEVIDEIHAGEGESLGTAARDSWISAQVKTRMLVDEKITSINYTIHTVNSVVYLMGVAQDQNELDEVIHIARNVAGVRQVVSNVILKGQKAGYHPATPSNLENTYIPPASPTSSGDLSHPNTGSAFNQ